MVSCTSSMVVCVERGGWFDQYGSLYLGEGRKKTPWAREKEIYTPHVLIASLVLIRAAQGKDL